MRSRLRSLLALLSSIALASCLADIPELSRATSTSDATSTTATSAVATSTATGFCAGQPKEVEFCADFENDGGASLGWDEVLLGAPYAHMEQDPSFGPDAPSLHAWVEEDGAGCLHSRLVKHLDPDRDAPVVIDLEVHPASFGIISTLFWERGQYDCNLLVRYLTDEVFLTFQAFGEGGGSDITTGVEFPHTLASPFGEWHHVRLLLDRESGQYEVELDGGAPLEASAEPNYMNWAAVCTAPAPEGRLEASIGSYCIHPPNGDFATNAYFDDVIFDFEGP